jgi:hypothetical protein
MLAEVVALAAIVLLWVERVLEAALLLNHH